MARSRPATRYTKSGDLSIAYQVYGDGPIDLAYVPGWVSNIELMWEEPNYARFLERLGSFSRLITFDKRGTGLSDRLPNAAMPTLEERMDDLRAVLDAVGSERVVLFGHSEGGNMSALFSATYPERTAALVTFGVFAARVWSPEYPWAPRVEEREQEIAELERTWGDEMDLKALAPTAAGDPVFQRRLATYLRHGASPGGAIALLRMNTLIDIREVLPTIRVPTLVIHRTDDREAHVEEGRWIAERVPGAKFVELPGADHLPWVGDADAVVAEIEEFVTGRRPVPEPDRVLATILFTDVVGSTKRAAEEGDSRWTSRLSEHNRLVRREIERFEGREIDAAGDGFLAIFGGPIRAIRCAFAAMEAVRPLGLDLRAGVHTGEIELMNGGVGGLGVHLGARVAGAASAGEVLVSRTVTDLVAGSGLTFEDRGLHELKGVPGEWRLFAVVADDV